MNDDRQSQPQCGTFTGLDEIEQNQETEVSTSQAQVDYDKGKEFLEAGDAALAASAFHNALIGFEQDKDDKGIANASDRLGDICIDRGEYSQAIPLYKRAFSICENHEDPSSKLALRKKIAAAHRSLKQYDEAIGIYLDIIDTYGGYNNPAGAVEHLETLAEVFLEMDAGEKAADAYRTAASIHANFNHTRHAKELMDKAEAIEAQK